ncbi:MAG: phenylacetate-CoA oxygenase/reductase subunit PaaK [Bacteroidetes bacterium]|nr:phenylacetate-CoA oxygenase/reductase subunit PaaK [Bacteroidota bacterium]
MSLQFNKLKVKEVRKETADCVSIVFDIPKHLEALYSFKQGQYITIKKDFNGEAIRRNYSICSSPFDQELRIAVKKIPNGIFSTYANDQLQKFDELEVFPPAGKFFSELSEEHENNYVAFAAGSGITPILSIIKTTLLTERKSSFTLVYGNRNRYSILFKEALEALKNKYLDRFRIIYILSREKTESDLHFGRIDEEKCQRILSSTIDPQKINAFFLCGPEEMIFSVKAFLKTISINDTKIHFELFNISNSVAPKNTILSNSNDAGINSKITVKQDGRSFDFLLPYHGNSILNAAMATGADLPFACKKGVCCTCKAKLIEGEVEMDRVYGLEPDEIDQGYILTCQAHPRSEKIVVDFDI